jgi:hypothetical protein
MQKHKQIVLISFLGLLATGLLAILRQHGKPVWVRGADSKR